MCQFFNELLSQFFKKDGQEKDANNLFGLLKI